MLTKELKLSGDRKVTPLSRWSTVKKTGKQVAKPKVFNSFGLPALGSCPGFTEWCKQVCYAFNLQRAWSNVDALVQHNLELLRSCGSNVNRMTELLTTLVNSVNWHGTDKVFRWHWDGDIFSLFYSHAIANTCRNTPDVQHWLYTRSFDFVVPLLDIPNLTVYLSVDSHNQKEAKRLYKRHPSLRIAACANTWDESESIVRAVTGRNAPRCPELTHKVPLVTSEGKGACVECGLCIYGRNNVRFASSN
jgi:hypothetical protein